MQSRKIPILRFLATLVGVLSLAVVLSGVTHAATVTLDFEDQQGYSEPLSGGGITWYEDGMYLRSNTRSDFYQSPVNNGGYSYLGTGNEWWPGTPYVDGLGGDITDTGSRHYVWAGDSENLPRDYVPAPAQLTLRRTNGTAFQLHSAELAFGGFISEIGLVGYSASGAEVTGDYSFLADGSGTTIFGDSWSDLVAVRVLINYGSEYYGACNFFNLGPQDCVVGTIDNVVLTQASAVPIPAAVWLFGSALGLLGAIRRLKVAKK